MQYKILTDDDSNLLSEAVGKMLSNGWELHGSLVIANRDNRPIYAQALTNEANPDTDEADSELTREDLAKILAGVPNLPAEELSPNEEQLADQLLQSLLSAARKRKDLKAGE